MILDSSIGSTLTLHCEHLYSFQIQKWKLERTTLLLTTIIIRLEWCTSMISKTEIDTKDMNSLNKSSWIQFKSSSQRWWSTVSEHLLGSLEIRRNFRRSIDLATHRNKRNGFLQGIRWKFRRNGFKIRIHIRIIVDLVNWFENVKSKKSTLRSDIKVARDMWLSSSRTRMSSISDLGGNKIITPKSFKAM